MLEFAGSVLCRESVQCDIESACAVMPATEPSLVILIIPHKEVCILISNNKVMPADQAQADPTSQHRQLLAHMHKNIFAK